MQFRPFKPVKILYKGIIPVTTTRLPWLHTNFSGVPGWKQDFIKKLEDKFEADQELRGTLKVLFKAFGRVVMLDSDRTEYWKIPKITYTLASVRAGWLYWAIIIIRGKIYYIPPEVEAEYKLLIDEDNLHTIIKMAMNSGDIEMLMDAMDIMLKLNYSNLRIQYRVISKSGDRIKYTVTYPRNQVIIESVNGIQNQVLAYTYHRILSTGGLDNRKCNLIHKDDMTPEQLEWLGEVD